MLLKRKPFLIKRLSEQFSRLIKIRKGKQRVSVAGRGITGTALLAIVAATSGRTVWNQVPGETEDLKVDSKRDSEKKNAAIASLRDVSKLDSSTELQHGNTITLERVKEIEDDLERIGLDLSSLALDQTGSNEVSGTEDSGIDNNVSLASVIDTLVRLGLEIDSIRAKPPNSSFTNPEANVEGLTLQLKSALLRRIGFYLSNAYSLGDPLDGLEIPPSLASSLANQSHMPVNIFESRSAPSYGQPSGHNLSGFDTLLPVLLSLPDARRKNDGKAFFSSINHSNKALLLDPEKDKSRFDQQQLRKFLEQWNKDDRSQATPFEYVVGMLRILKKIHAKQLETEDIECDEYIRRGTPIIRSHAQSATDDELRTANLHEKLPRTQNFQGGAPEIKGNLSSNSTAIAYHSIRALATLAVKGENRRELLEFNCLESLGNVLAAVESKLMDMKVSGSELEKNGHEDLEIGVNTWERPKTQIANRASEELMLIQGQVARALANLALDNKGANDIVRLGYLKRLYLWAGDDKIRFSADHKPISGKWGRHIVKRQLQALRALKNVHSTLHRSENRPGYPDEVYLFHPALEAPSETRRRFRTSEHQKKETQRNRTGVDIVFVHGMLGNPMWTWRSTPERHKSPTMGNGVLVWPRDWLQKDLQIVKQGYDVRILSIGYPTFLTYWEGSGVREHCKSLLKRLTKAQVGLSADDSNRKVIFVGHSMGGLVIKEMLATAGDSLDPRVRALRQNTKGLVFYAVPHLGSEKASMIHALAPVLSSAQDFADIRANHKRLLQLHSDVRNLHDCGQLKVLSFSETVKTPMRPWKSSDKTLFECYIVSPEEANPEFGEFSILQGKRHIDVCKPSSKDDDCYTRLVSFIDRCSLE
mmetsp:Transcript_27370/g.66565  ORF Transcript_27370/g.66565 Transcript_27370/m.66565 type:complete len:873 (+) Transcript_27370:118-2736(+)